jgi:hypothetical protein
LHARWVLHRPHRRLMRLVANSPRFRSYNVTGACSKVCPIFWVQVRAARRYAGYCGRRASLGAGTLL